MTELQRTLKLVEQSLCQISTAGRATLRMADALRLLVRAQELAAEPEKKEDAEHGEGNGN